MPVGQGKEADNMTVTIYGIKNCDTMKKARSWLEATGIDYSFHDYKSAGIDRTHLETWCDAAGWETVLNRVGTTFKKLDDGKKADLDREKAIELMLEQPSMIKRPVLEARDKITVGFKPDTYQTLFA
jgi:Spx/MgsR family transcriptional regulator